MANLQKKKEEEKVRLSVLPGFLASSYAFWLVGCPYIIICFATNDFDCNSHDEQALKELKSKAQQKGAFGGSGLKKSGKK